MKELRWLREEPKSRPFFIFYFLFFIFYFLLYFLFCFYLRPKAEAISTKIACNRKGYGRNKLPPSPSHRRGGGKRGKKTPGLKPAPSARGLKTTTKYT